jgi:hypothetical protein
MRIRFVALLAGLALGAAPAAAELIEYRLPDGSTGFTDAAEHVPPDAEIVSTREEAAPPPEASAPVEAERAAAAPAAPARDAEPEPDLEAEEEARWRERARQAQRAAREARIHAEAAERVYADCRGSQSYWMWRQRVPGWHDPELRDSTACQDEGAALQSAQEAVAEADSYLADGLFEDCRRAGCLPGWIR